MERESDLRRKDIPAPAATRMCREAVRLSKRSRHRTGLREVHRPVRSTIRS